MKNKLLYICINLFINYSFSNNQIIIDEELLISCQLAGHSLFNACVKIPPTTPEQITLCEGMRTSYLSCSLLLSNKHSSNLKPMDSAKKQSPYFFSPYDPCKFEVNYLVLFDICN